MVIESPKAKLDKLREPHAVVECANGEIVIQLNQIKEMIMEAHVVEDRSILTVQMRDGSQALFFGTPDPLKELGNTFNTQSRTMAIVKAPHLRYAFMPGIRAKITGPASYQ